jgi:predicted nucleic acid-binding protein
MTGKVFVDSNILIYAHDAGAGAKQVEAARQLRDLWSDRNGCLSAQVLQEFYVIVTHKIKNPLDKGTAREVIRTYGLWIENPATAATILRASEIGEGSQLSFWDSMILASAEEC